MSGYNYYAGCTTQIAEDPREQKEPTTGECEICYQKLPIEELKMRDVELPRITGKKKMIMEKRNLLTCQKCGEFYEPKPE